MEHPFLREEMALGTAALERLSHSHVAVFGIGGVGSFTVEALARGGVGQLTLVDNDTVGLTNLNRQLCALHSTLGQYKAQVMADRVRDISPRLPGPRHHPAVHRSRQSILLRRLLRLCGRRH